MTKRAVHSVRLLASVIALCLVLLQVVNSLHFALVPHGFGAGLSGFVHLHRALTAESGRAFSSAATAPTTSHPTLAAEIAGCAPDACPFGFSGPPTRAVPPSELCSLIWLPALSESASHDRVFYDRSRALLSAPKTSPPLQA